MYQCLKLLGIFSEADGIIDPVLGYKNIVMIYEEIAEKTGVSFS
jgi:hypothetical protein